METLTDIAMWSKSHPAWGMRRRIQRNAYAFAVAMVMTNGLMVCPACLGDFDIDMGEVDRAIPSLDYRPGNVVYICHGCNHGRGILQGMRPIPRDWTHVDEYVRDVQRASQGVPIPSEREAKAWWSHRPTVVTHPRYA